MAAEGTIKFACGLNDYGQLGLGDDYNRNTFTAVPALPDGKVAKQVIPGFRHTMILVEDGTVFACGNNDYGELGLGDTTNRDTFTAVPFFGADHPGLVPSMSTLAQCTFAVPAPQGEGIRTAAVSPLQADLMALVSDDEVLHCDMTLVGSDGVSVEAHRALIHGRCPKLFQQQQQQQQQQQSTSSSSSSSSSSLSVAPISFSSPRRVSDTTRTTPATTPFTAPPPPPPPPLLLTPADACFRRVSVKRKSAVGAECPGSMVSRCRTVGGSKSATFIGWSVVSSGMREASRKR